MSAVTRHITYHFSVPNDAVVKQDVTKEELDLAVMKMADDWEPPDGESRVEMHFKGLCVHVVAEAKIIEKPIGAAYGESGPSVVTQNWDDVAQSVVDSAERILPPPVLVVPPQPPLSRLFRAFEYIPEKRIRQTLLLTITDAQEDYNEALMADDTKRANLVIWYALWNITRTLVWGLRWLLPLIKWFFTKH